MQFVKEPTRRQGNSSNTFDLVLPNRPDIFCNVGVKPGISEKHSAVYTEAILPQSTACQTQNLHQKAA